MERKGSTLGDMYKEPSSLNQIQKEHLKQARLHLCSVLESSPRGASHYEDINDVVEYLEELIVLK